MNKLKIWITGAQGKLGTSLVKYLNNLDYTVLPTDKEVDITRLDEVMNYGEVNRPDIIINCAAITGINVCKENEIEAYKVNGLGARNIAIVSQKIHATTIHLSTDDVFEGKNNQKLNEFETPYPNTIYGKSKLVGENFVRELNPKHIIIRSSWLYDNSKGNFLYDLFEEVHNKKHVKVSKEQISSPTSVLSLCKVIETLMNESEYGLFHASCEGECSRYEFAKKALEIAGYDQEYIEEGNNDYGQNGHFILENLMLKMTNIYILPSWQEDLENFLKKEI